MKTIISYTCIGILLSVLFLSLCVKQVSADETISISATVGSGTSGGSGGGGGGGGGGYNAPTGITFSGKAYPLSSVIVLMNGQEVVRTIAGPDAQFSVTLGTLNPGNYTFSILGEDQNGRRSALFTFPILISQGATTTVSGIFIAPTIDVDKVQVKQGDNLTIFGQTVPGSSVTISVHSNPEYFYQVQSDTRGAYLLALDTSPLAIGNHQTKSKSQISASELSSFGKVISFAVGGVTIPKDGTCRRGDINCDGRVNLVDFSIMAFWYKKVSPPTKVDFNNDSKVSLIDFSILAYYWTG